VLGATAGFAYWFWSWRRRRAELKRASEERFASFMAQALVASKPKAGAPRVDPALLAKQKALLDAAAKAAEAGEPVLSIQLYARLIARYPDSAYAAQARAAVEQQKKNLAKA
jgi:hypothetical protein